MKNKKAIIKEFGKPGVIQIIEHDITEPKAGDARIKIDTATVSATDIFIRKGIYPLLKQKPPFTLGYDFVGTVDKVGEGVANVKAGDRVCDIVMAGGNANYICTNAATLTNIPKDADAAAAGCFALSGITAYQIPALCKDKARATNINSRRQWRYWGYPVAIRTIISLPNGGNGFRK